MFILNKYKINIIIFIFLTMLLPSIIISILMHPKEIYVGVNDSIKHKLANAKSGDVIKLEAGVFDIGYSLNIPSGVTLLGSGKDKTILKGNIHLRRSNNVALYNLRMDGNQRKIRYALQIGNVDGFKLHNVDFRNYKATAILLHKSKNINLGNFTILNSSGGETSKMGYSPAIGIGSIENTVIQNFFIDTRQSKGRGIATSQSDEIWQHRRRDKKPPYYSLQNVKIRNCKIRTEGKHFWSTKNGHHPPEMNIELYRTQKQLEISYCDFNGNLSFVGELPKDIKNNYLHIHHNSWYSLPVTKHYSYALELDVSNVEVAYNHIKNPGGKGGAFFIAGWAHNQRHNWNIHHNVVEGTKIPIRLSTNTPKPPQVHVNGFNLSDNVFINSGGRHDGKLIYISGNRSLKNVSVKNNNIFSDKIKKIGINANISGNLIDNNSKKNAYEFIKWKVGPSF